MKAEALNRRRTFRPEIQALRAFAVLAVALYHLWPNRAPGGYIGVDVFFAISGYLIIAGLLRSVETTGRVRILDFWARRARRLLPASLLAVVAFAVGVIVWVPTAFWGQFFAELAAAATYAENWLLAINSVDYLAANNAPSPVQHYWSLSVEEQFYIVWPLVIAAVLLVLRGRSAPARRRGLGITLAALTAASLAWACYEMTVSPSFEYFDTAGRAWEFGAGGLLAYFAGERAGLSRERLRAVASWLGIAALFAMVFAYTADLPFPGITAVPPVLGTLLVIWAGTPQVKWAPTAILRLTPIQSLGDISYSLYLWHWGLIVIAGYALQHTLGWHSKLVILAASLAIAWLSKRYVEDPVRHWRRLIDRRALLTVVSAVAVTALVAAGGLGMAAYARSTVVDVGRLADQMIANGAKCVGAPAVLPENHCAKPYAVTDLTSPAFAAQDVGDGILASAGCRQGATSTKVLVCTRGDTTHPDTTIALFGDSHAGNLLDALDVYGKSHHIKILTYIKEWCAGLGVPDIASAEYGPTTQKVMDSCTSWGQAALQKIAADPHISAIVTSQYTRPYTEPSRIGRTATADDFETFYRNALNTGKTVIAVRDIPNTRHVNVAQCVAEHLNSYDPCTVPITDGMLLPAQDPVVQAAQAVPQVHLIDLTSVFCTGSTCHNVIGGLVVHFDLSHLTATFSRTLAPVLGPKVAAALAR